MQIFDTIVNAVKPLFGYNQQPVTASTAPSRPSRFSRIREDIYAAYRRVVGFFDGRGEKRPFLWMIAFVLGLSFLGRLGDC
jgi:hypothetical protein